ncbi:hypothetical protein A3K29_01920 [Candidatus Collierbacteria bacterium RIFOXYB2_FULL_46_14]|uniref:Uncharacterized protein n=1 Tax=Candidatus Collierbacteria bacterium GW2011_GWA2_46_26 TaxID=1618381 RepID=A0A0G1PJN4_9BACT|nr:MAG: hypothetical protein UW29_C0011G0024 [Candidatus Collierbacteria bacterium GW2011_GWC2_44_13]KKU32907.1 MAG: hypothetical protein UX47_C0007G0151 [Candidatus Collierbacteria bacterium GW2011_GWA2_46_26]OGD72885.1 MAG: hypothetical protein A3K29_01920 [Candidatus Collierbacteria bacterium RIFOXYB2_FULL_46_14]OGD75927.1 MAG: hypothetical protein A3K43_01920 [Candidatus Collierbacteria bacterium RIFOXYA2_FULL_46_20]OGD77263.1 MAG: hypothetical protein A3K39_01920 [Candidatus Collierbacteri
MPSGIAWHVEDEIRQMLKGKLPQGCALEFEETEESHSVGVLMDDHDEFNGRLTITLTGAETRVLASLKSSNTFRESVSGGNSFDRNQYHYSIRDITVIRWFENIPAQ